MTEEQNNVDSINSETPSVDEGTTQTVPMVLITLAQRAALIEFMAKQPYADVANGIEFLRSAPQVNVNITAPSSADSSDIQTAD